jgi:hypothetical protein
MGVTLEGLAVACACLGPGILASVAEGRIRPVVSLVLGLRDAERGGLRAASGPSARSPSLCHNLAPVMPVPASEPVPGAEIMIFDDLRQRRLKVINEHMDTEVTGESDLTLATFNGHPHYEIVPTGQVLDGAAEVMGYYQASRAAFPGLRHGNVRCHVADDTIIVEFDLLGTNLGGFAGVQR